MLLQDVGGVKTVVKGGWTMLVAEAAAWVNAMVLTLEYQRARGALDGLPKNGLLMSLKREKILLREPHGHRRAGSDPTPAIRGPL